MRDPLGKETFLGGNRQKWCLVFLASGLLVLVANVIFPGVVDPVPYMNFLLALGTTFILGSSASDWAKTQRVGSLRETEVKEETKRIQVDVKDDSEPDTNIINDFRMQYSNDPSYAPEDWINEQETGEQFR